MLGGFKFAKKTGSRSFAQTLGCAQAVRGSEGLTVPAEITWWGGRRNPKTTRQEGRSQGT
eukprot:168786-Chlamydomonas_euryale.AAC.1